MEIKDLKDFYIDLDGDVKATNGNSNIAMFVTDTNKLNSEYIIANDLDEIKELLSEINPLFELDIEIFKQYSIKRDKNGNTIGIKIYVDNNDQVDNLNMLLTGYDITSDSVTRDYYFTASTDAVNEFIEKNKLVYEIKEYETHKHFLHSVKYDINNKIINFKTYYIVNENSVYYTNEMIPHLKKVLRFV
jgi:hypothetical protein